MSDSDFVFDERPEPESALADEAVGEEAADEVSEAAGGEDVADAPKKPARRRKRSIFQDPVVRTMTFVALGLVVLYLITVASALVMGILGSTEPRTAVERDVQLYEAQAMQNPQNTAIWLEYITALIESEQYLKAQDVIDRATAALDQSKTQDIAVAQAQLYFAQGRFDECIELADQIRETLKTNYDEAKKDTDSPEYKGAPIDDSYYLALIVKAEAQVELGDDEGALESLTLYLDDNPTAADVFVRRGDLRATLGDTAGAEADFREALRFIPDDAAALEGLKKIGVER